MAYANPVRLEVHKRLTDVLKEISIANGYAVDLNEQVYRGRIVFGSETPVPAIAILEVPIPLELMPPPADSTVVSGPWELMVQGWVEDDRENPTDPAHVLMADVKRCLAKEKKRANWDDEDDGIFGLGRNVVNLYIGSGVVRPPEEVSSKAYFWLTITVDLAEDLENPYEE